jgi:CDP-diacylglycerol--glycerol-3-phosphate 3-phosphatidyltransferase
VTFANALTAVRGLLVLPVIALVATGNAGLALLVFLAAAATDALDGPLARRRGATDLGAALDPLADKILIVGTLAALAVRGLAPTWAVVLIFARELVAIEVRARSARALGAHADGKAKTILQVAAIAVLLGAAAWPALLLGAAANGLLVAATALTVLSGVRLVLRAKQTTPDAA